jgi:hypothetical protein
MVAFWFSYFRDHDHDKDGKLSFEEFEQQVYDLIRSHDEESGHREDDLDISARRESGAKRKFAELDQNKDRQVLLLLFIHSFFATNKV